MTYKFFIFEIVTTFLLMNHINYLRHLVDLNFIPKTISISFLFYIQLTHKNSLGFASLIKCAIKINNKVNNSKRLLIILWIQAN